MTQNKDDLWRKVWEQVKDDQPKPLKSWFEIYREDPQYAHLRDPDISKKVLEMVEYMRGPKLSYAYIISKIEESVHSRVTL